METVKEFSEKVTNPRNKLIVATSLHFQLPLITCDKNLLDADGKLIENPYHYRDSQTNGMMERAFELFSKREIYQNTGVQFMQLNSLYQLLATRLNNSAPSARAKRLISANIRPVTGPIV